MNIQGFIQAILMPIREHKTLNLITEFSNSILITFYFKNFGIAILLKIHWLTRFLLF